ncbi:MAG: hypothetical protein M1503_06425 [Thaumarchaeota archaeon]|nr:hypothetical protein [Nitrososphaerota archaeon]MCL5317878.1 hypothetical protein [Nitrososphaerota archaeon]
MPEQLGSSRGRVIILLVVAVMLVSLGVYGAFGAAGQIATTTPHSIVAKGESSCLKCHYGIYEEMVSTNHSRTIVRELMSIKNDGPDANACLVCHGKRDRWGSFGMADWVVWLKNSTAPVNQSRWVSLGYKQVPFPYGKGYSGAWSNSTATASSTLSIDMYSATAGASIQANLTFFDYAADNTDLLMILSESSSGHYTASIAGIYPDYFRIQLRSDKNLTASSLTVSSDGSIYEVSATGKKELSLSNISTVTLAPMVKNKTTGAWTWDRYADDWNFHTGAYTNVAKMSSVWENIRTIATATFPTRGVPIDYLGVTGEKSSCSSTQGLCHSTLRMINLTSEGKLHETRAAYGYLPYYEHSMTLSTDPSKTCGICHAPMFADGPTTHYNGNCYTCHNSHAIKKQP